MRNRPSVLGCLVLVVALLFADLAPGADRTYTAAHCALEIEGERQLASSVGGGSAVGVVSATPSGGAMDKHISGVKYDDIVVSVPPDRIPAAVRDALEGRKPTVQGGIDYADFNFNVERRLSFQDATVTLVRFPALDSAAKENAAVEIVLSPGSTREESGSGDIKSKLGDKRKAVLTSNFRVTIGGGDVPTSRIASVGAIEIRAAGTNSPTGAGGGGKQAAGAYDVSNITMSVSAADLKAWQEWLDKTLADRGSKQERTMQLALLDTNMKDAIFELELQGVGLISVRPRAIEAGASDKVARFDVELYAEQFKFGGGGGKGTAAAEAPKSDAAKAAPERPVRRPR